MQQFRAIHITYTSLFVCLMVIGANIAIWFPFLTVPIGGASVPLSLQTFFAILAGMILGKRLGAFAMIVYILIGLTGLPVFAGLKGGLYPMISPTGGFIISFVFIAFIVGWILENKSVYSSKDLITVAIIGLMINYTLGVTYMYIAMNEWLELPISYLTAWIGMVPFLVKDSVLTIVAAITMMALQKRVSSIPVIQNISR
ncbi:biotin biosynthesis [Oceanobacillus iheyensis HTE831]|uniref:Biotin transporter n=1 Tax=Oceanobacillus iheyensis (strain DSM 14371 / CIP 107618 / JCM 11309 / KCTC 3954 / HTE831) TaxID=221109 RepID=Q8ENX9_OCEIH|nr:biotin transporter BioY [Oceanobacillus iheyensis]BAC14302.1 biotin biosynthesis [Oceanobacillus iheyensis HTE831]